MIPLMRRNGEEGAAPARGRTGNNGVISVMCVTVLERQRDHGHRTFIKGATTVSKEPKPSCYELTEQELENAVGGADNLLQIAGIDGESQDDKKRNQIEVQSFGQK